MVSKSTLHKNKPSGILILANKISFIPGIFEIKGILSSIKLKPNKIKTDLIAKSDCIIKDDK